MNDTDYILEVEKILILHVENQNNTVTGGDLVDYEKQFHQLNKDVFDELHETATLKSLIYVISIFVIYCILVIITILHETYKNYGSIDCRTIKKTLSSCAKQKPYQRRSSPSAWNHPSRSTRGWVKTPRLWQFHLLIMKKVHLAAPRFWRINFYYLIWNNITFEQNIHGFNNPFCRRESVNM